MRAVALITAILFVTGPIQAQPEVHNLRAFRAVVPDYSKSSGGSEPALSPDGKTLAFTTGVWSIWILHSDNMMTDKAEPWKLQIEPERGATGGSDQSSSHNIDWSPDGKRVVFSCGDSYLYLTENFDFEGKTADIRIIAKPKLYEGDTSTRDIDAPRWSPDGRKIAFVRSRWSNAAVLCVLDLDTGVETELARNVCDGYESYIWEQPWSPDSRQLAFATCSLEKQTNGGATIHYTGIDVISIDGKERRQVVEGKTYTPSWSPNSDRIAYSITLNYTLKEGKVNVSNYYHTIKATDSRGAKHQALYQHDLPTDEQVAAHSEQKQKAMEYTFGYEFKSRLTPDQEKRLRSGRMTGNEMTTISATFAAREIDSDFAKLIENRLKAISEDEEINIWTDPVISKAVSELSQEKRMQFITGASKWYMLSLMATAHPGLDTLPVWSHDGQKLAFVRQDVWEDRATLMVVDVESRKPVPLFSAHEITNVSWTPGGKILMQATRLTSRDGTGETIKQTPSYPEIWLLEPKPVN